MARSILVHPGDANECLRIGAAQLTAEPIPPFPEETCLAMSHNVKVFGCRPLAERGRTHRRPAYENLQRRKPRWGNACRCRALDLRGFESRAHSQRQ
jgi:hypothetical protein